MSRLRRFSLWRAAAPVALLCAGLLFATSATNARGTDLRPSRNTTLAGLVEEQSRRSATLTRQHAALSGDIEKLQTQQGAIEPKLAKQLKDLSVQVGTTPVTGPGLTVTLKDAPREVVKDNPDIDADWLVIHQQDIQAVVNALWAGGADAISIQNHRVISTTGIKCVGNSVVLHGVPYLPPYKITAIGDRRKLQQALDDSQYIENLQDYVVRFQLGYEVKNESNVAMPAYEGTLDLQSATVPGFETTPSVSPSASGR
ncbi:protein of unknown function DUF881 [Kribbella flavida DSM 17836]|uniref:Membrane spanning protein DUF881 n=1 Tax=Kribbella flavida (strain DSM 17836 / JCM 10339 / NBRC 14399) TaxID=479435 RepID=D2PQK0_KRIFD|nr:DUF881 domain-containing protein [Kribbella flavida]ADB29187.1 protein of unknown function DUF881 [Kribbella flavida DSM 17836]